VILSQLLSQSLKEQERTLSGLPLDEVRSKAIGSLDIAKRVEAKCRDSAAGEKEHGLPAIWQ
jgi:hypothetical protein